MSQVLIIADEIYEMITYDEPHYCFAAIDGMCARFVQSCHCKA